MLGKIIKYDTKRMLKQILPFIIIAISFSTLTFLARLLPESSFREILVKILEGTTTGFAIISLMINVIIRVWFQFRTSIYGDEGYLTNTLPINKNIIFLGKVLSGMIIVLIGVVIAVLSFILIYLNTDFFTGIFESIKVIGSGSEIPIPALLVMTALLVLLEVISFVFMGYFGCVFGHRCHDNKNFKSFLFGLAGYGITQGIVLICMLLMGFINRDIFSIFTTTNFSLDILYYLIIAGVIGYLLSIRILALITGRAFQRGINLD